MNLQTLAAELTDDPAAIGYSGMDDAAAAAAINLPRNHNRASVSGDEMFAATDASEFAGLTDAQRQLWVSFTRAPSIDPFGTANVAFVQSIFGSGPTLTALNALRVEQRSRAQVLGLGKVGPGHVNKARAL